MRPLMSGSGFSARKLEKCFFWFMMFNKAAPWVTWQVSVVFAKSIRLLCSTTEHDEASSCLRARMDE